MAHERANSSRGHSRRIAEAARAARTRASRAESGQPARRSGGAMDVFGGEIRRRDVFPLLVLHLIEREPAYGNRLIEEIEGITDGVISVNPNTIYPLLRDLEARGLIEGQWEHPDRRTRRFYSITAAGRKEYRRLVTELEPFLDSVIKSVTLIKREIYEGRGGSRRGR
jgi:PadR family transcriptional regulator, regulatory protein PadR